VNADDWPQWRGQNIDGISKETGWSTQPTKTWEKSLGVGCSSVSVVGDRVFTMGYNNGQDVVFCLDAATGRKIWTQSYRSGRWKQMHQGGPGSTPAVYQGRVYTVGREGQVHCYDAKTGDPVWQKNLASELSINPPKFGFTGSVVIIDDQLMIDMGSIASLNPASGDVNWKTRNYGAAYSTPAPFEMGNKKLLATFPKSGLVILGRSNGKKVASFPWKTQYGINAATPVIKRNTIFISSGYNSGCAMLKLQGNNLKPAWQNKQMRNHMASSIIDGNHIYGFDESLFKCIDPHSGKRLWREKALGKGAFMIANHKLIILSEKGELLIANASPQKFSALSRTKAVNGKTWVMPVLANGRIYCKNNSGQLVSFNVRN